MFDGNNHLLFSGHLSSELVFFVTYYEDEILPFSILSSFSLLSTMAKKKQEVLKRSTLSQLLSFQLPILALIPSGVTRQVSLYRSTWQVSLDRSGRTGQRGRDTRTWQQGLDCGDRWAGDKSNGAGQLGGTGGTGLEDRTDRTGQHRCDNHGRTVRSPGVRVSHSFFFIRGAFSLDSCLLPFFQSNQELLFSSPFFSKHVMRAALYLAYWPPTGGLDYCLIGVVVGLSLGPKLWDSWPPLSFSSTGPASPDWSSQKPFDLSLLDQNDSLGLLQDVPWALSRNPWISDYSGDTIVAIIELDYTAMLEMRHQCWWGLLLILKKATCEPTGKAKKPSSECLIYHS